MPLYTLLCPDSNGLHTPVEKLMTFAQYDRGIKRGYGACPDCGGGLTPALNQSALYGMMRVKDSDFADAEEATGEKITSTRDIDRLEKAGVIRAITNPSRYRKFKEKK